MSATVKVGFNDAHHCTHCIRGPYSKVFNKKNSALACTNPVVFSEREIGEYDAVYLCGVANTGYARGENYPHNLHLAIRPDQGSRDRVTFEQWVFDVEDGLFLPIPEQGQLPSQYRSYPEAYVTCRIFRWAAVRYRG